MCFLRDLARPALFATHNTVTSVIQPCQNLFFGIEYGTIQHRQQLAGTYNNDHTLIDFGTLEERGNTAFSIVIIKRKYG
jgi:hypothetical protein